MIGILFVDNDPDFLATRAEFLERAGYQVTKATNLADAEKHLREGLIHLAIIDIRMMDDDDEKDVSGMTLINADFARAITKIVLTSFNTPLVRDLVRAAQPGQPLIIDVIEKGEGPATLIEAVNEAITRHVRINWDLVIDWKARDHFSLVKLIDPELEGERLLNRAEEFKYLLCRLFYEKDQIRIQRLLWQQPGRVALIIIAFKKGMHQESFVVVCGQNAILNQEMGSFKEFAPDAPSETGTKLSAAEETPHFSANAYTFARMDLEHVKSLNELYHIATPKLFKETLTTLFQRTLAEWHQDRPTYVESSLELLYQHRLQLPDIAASHIYFEERVRAIEKHALEHSLRIEHVGDRVSFILGEKEFSFSNPLLLLLSHRNEADGTLIVNVPGNLTGENILVDEASHAWLTDFATAGQAPIFWNYVALEAVIRFDWTDTHSFLRRKELEDCLIHGELTKPDIRSLEPEMKKPAQAIVGLRKLASRVAIQNVADYQLGIFYQASRRLADFNPAYSLSTAEFMRLAHIYLSMAMLTSSLLEKMHGGAAKKTDRAGEIVILDRKARLISVGGRTLRLTRQHYALFEYLYNKAGEVCTKKELVSEALQGNYSEEYAHTLVMRIRKRIEDDPEEPRYLINEPSAGYRLIIKPR